MQKRFEPLHNNASSIVDYIMSVPELPEDAGLQFKIRLCTEEAVVNVVNYAYKDGQGFLDVETEMEDGVFTITLRDAGIPFDPLENPDPDITLSADERQIGGLGIFLCKQMMDEVAYIWENGCNVLTMRMKTH